MSFTYTFTKANVIYTYELQKFLKSINDFTNIMYINYKIDILDIVFNTELTIDQETLLDTTITNYIPPQNINIVSNIDTLNIINSTNTTITYDIVSVCIYNYNLRNYNNDELKRIQVLSSINDGSYNLRVYDIVNNILLDELIGLNNKNNEIHTLNITHNFTEDTIIEIGCLVSNNINTCTIQGCFVIYEKKI